jgi:Polyketide cyclase / dehydrase and lipid transport
MGTGMVAGTRSMLSNAVMTSNESRTMRTISGTFNQGARRAWILSAAILSVSATTFTARAFGATIRIETPIAASVTDVWAAVRDVGAVSTRLAPGFVVDTRLEDGIRTVRFANGAVVRERIISIDDASHRLGYSAIDGLPAFHFASIEVVPDKDGCRLIWTADVLPDSVAARIRALMEEGLVVMKSTLETAAATSQRRTGR